MSIKRGIARLPVPKVDSRSLVQGDQLTPRAKEFILAIAREYNLPVMGITLMGNKPYVNSTGLDAKIKEKAKEMDWEYVKCEVEMLQRAELEIEKRRAGYKATITYFDKKGYLKALDILKTKEISFDILDKLEKTFKHSFANEGWASISSVKMSTLHNPDYINMMALTRATNRAKKQAVGCGLTSIEETGTDIQGITLDAEFTTETQEQKPILQGQIQIIQKLVKGNDMLLGTFLKEYKKEKVGELTKNEATEVIQKIRNAGGKDEETR